jgi:hypothetical protein
MAKQLTKDYKMRAVGRGGWNTIIPKEVLERAAVETGQTIEEFANTHAVRHYMEGIRAIDGHRIDGAYEFVRIN